MVRAFLALTACLIAAFLPVTGGAASTSQKEFLDALRSKPNAAEGAGLFRDCAVCHGPLGAGRPDGMVPRIGGQHFSVLVKELTDYRHDRRWDISMEHFANTHHLVDAQAVADVAEFVSQLGVLAVPGVGAGDQLDRGAKVYRQSCRSCHGPAGEGNAKRTIPQLAGQHYEYLQRQIYDAVDGRRPNFSRAHVRLLAGLGRDDVQGVADYLSRQKRHYDPPLQLAAR